MTSNSFGVSRGVPVNSCPSSRTMEGFVMSNFRDHTPSSKRILTLVSSSLSSQRTASTPDPCWTAVPSVEELPFVFRMLPEAGAKASLRSHSACVRPAAGQPVETCGRISLTGNTRSGQTLSSETMALFDCSAARVLRRRRRVRHFSLDRLGSETRPFTAVKTLMGESIFE